MTSDNLCKKGTVLVDSCWLCKEKITVHHLLLYHKMSRDMWSTFLTLNGEAAKAMLRLTVDVLPAWKDVQQRKE